MTTEEFEYYKKIEDARIEKAMDVARLMDIDGYHLVDEADHNKVSHLNA